MKKKSLVLCGMVAVLMFMAVIPVGVAAATCTATCDEARKAKGECFESKGYVIEVVKDGESFPQINTDGNSVFKYKITRCDSRKKLVSLAGILIPVCPSPLGRPIAFMCEPISCTGQEFFGGSGDPLTGFGFGLITDDTWRWNWLWPLRWPVGLPSGTGTVSITMTGRVYASQNPMMVATGLLRSDFPYGQILAPSCGLIPAQIFPTQVPIATKKEEQIGDVKICSASTDQSGCPASVYSCSDTSLGCDCPEDLRYSWDKKPLSEVQIESGKLMQVWTDPDPRCPGTYVITKGSTCVKKCYPSGYCFVGPRGCTP